MSRETIKRKVWTKPQIKRLGQLKDVAQNTNISSANGGMS